MRSATVQSTIVLANRKNESKSRRGRHVGRLFKRGGHLFHHPNQSCFVQHLSAQWRGGSPGAEISAFSEICSRAGRKEASQFVRHSLFYPPDTSNLKNIIGYIHNLLNRCLDIFLVW